MNKILSSNVISVLLGKNPDGIFHIILKNALKQCPRRYEINAVTTLCMNNNVNDPHLKKYIDMTRNVTKRYEHLVPFNS